MKQDEEKLLYILYECNQHTKMLDYSFSKIKKHLPLSVDKYLEFTEETIGLIDQVVFRYSKLQDAIGEKLFFLLLKMLGEDYSKKPFIDMAHRLEKIDLINAEEWFFLRKIRNDIAHQYTLDTNELIESLTVLFEAKDLLLNRYNGIYAYIKDRFPHIKESDVLK